MGNFLNKKVENKWMIKDYLNYILHILKIQELVKAKVHYKRNNTKVKNL